MVIKITMLLKAQNTLHVYMDAFQILNSDSKLILMCFFWMNSACSNCFFEIYSSNNYASDLLPKIISKNIQRLFQKLRSGEKNLVKILMNYFDIWVNITVQYYTMLLKAFPLRFLLKLILVSHIALLSCQSYLKKKVMTVMDFGFQNVDISI